MADDIQLDDFELDDFELGQDIDFNGEVKDDRKPITKIKDGAIGGVKELATDASFLKTTALRALPDGYEKGARTAGDAVDLGKSLYDTTVSEFTPAVKELKRTGRRILPKVKKFLPNSLGDRLDSFVRDEELSVNAAKEASDENTVAIALGHIFKEKSVADNESDVRDETRALLKEEADGKRHLATTSIQEAINESLGRLVSYQDTINNAYQKKSLELQYRHYFAARDHLEFFKAYAKDSKDRLDIIGKNTGLPEHTKVRMAEVSDQMIRERLIGSVHEKASDIAGNALRNIGKNATSRIKEFGTGLSEGLSTANDISDTLADLGDMPGVDGTEMAAGQGAQLLGGALGNKLADYLKPILERNEKIVEYGERAGYAAENSEALLAEGLLGGNGELLGEFDENGERNSFMARARSAASFMAGQLAGVQNTSTSLIRQNLLDTGDEAVAFSKLARQSITEIIPGYLSRIHHELHKIGTGDQDAERLVYNLEAEDFTGMQQALGDASARLMGKNDINYVKGSIQAAVDIIDPEKSLSEKARKELTKLIINDSKDGLAFTHDRYSDADKIDNSVSKDIRGEIAQFFRSTFQGEDGRLAAGVEPARKLRRASKAVRQAQDYMPNIAMDAAKFSSAGGRDMLSGLGLLGARTKDREEILSGKFYDALTTIIARTGGGDDREISNDGASPLFNSLSTYNTSRADIHGTAKDSPRSGPFGHTEQTEEQRIGRIGGSGRIKAIDEFKTTSLETLTRIDATGSAILSLLEERAEGETTVGRWDTSQDDLLTYTQATDLTERSIGALGGLARAEQSAETNALLSNILGIMAGQVGEGAVGAVVSNVKTAVSRGKDYLAKGAGTLKSYYGAIFSMGNATLKMGIDNLKGAASGIREQLSIVDIYVVGEPDPALTARKLRQGQYRLKESKTVVKVVGDITEPVIDLSGMVVLTAEDIERGLETRVGKSLMNKGSAVLGAYYSNLFKGTRGIIDTGRALAKGAFTQAKDYLKKKVDVYVEGEKVPRLYARVLEAGGYVSSKTGKVIRSIKDIDSDVLDADGNVALKLSELGRIRDRFGKAIRGGGDKLSALKDKVIGIYGGAYSKLKDVGKSALNLVKGGIDNLTGGFSSKRRSMFEGNLEEFTDRNIELLEEIRDLIDERVPLKKRVRGDLDGDGLREGGWREQLAEKQAAKSKGEAVQKSRDKDKPKAGPLQRMLQAMMGGGDDGDDGDTNIGMDFGDSDGKDKRKDRKNRKSKGGGKKGFFRRMASKGGNLLKGAGRFAMRSAGMTAAMSALPSGAALAGAAGTVASVGGSILAGIGAVLSSPVVLGGLAVAAVAGGAYLAYKHFSKDKLSLLDKLRYLQYGVSPEQEERYKLVSWLESKVWPLIKLSGDKATLKISDNLVNEALVAFGLSGQGRRKDWVNWFNARFKPVLLMHYALYKKYCPEAKLNELEAQIGGKERLEYVEKAAAFYKQSNAGQVFRGPFNDGNLHLLGSGAYNAILKEALETYAKQKEDGVKGKKKSGGAKATPQEVAKGVNDTRVAATDESEDQALKDKAPGTTEDKASALSDAVAPSLVAMADKSGGKNDSKDAIVEAGKAQVEMQTAQAEAQTNYRSQQLNENMRETVNILRNSYDVQVSIRDELKSMNQLMQFINADETKDLRAEQQKRLQEVAKKLKQSRADSGKSQVAKAMPKNPVLITQ